jgi:hypothetical protein
MPHQDGVAQAAVQTGRSIAPLRDAGVTRATNTSRSEADPNEPLAPQAPPAPGRQTSATAATILRPSVGFWTQHR